MFFWCINILLYFEFPRYEEQKQSQWHWRKRQRWSYLTTLQLYIYWIPHWPPVLLKMYSGVLLHTLKGTINNSQSHKKKMSSSFTSILRAHSSIADLHNIRPADHESFSCGPREFSQLQKMLQKLDLSRISSMLQRNLHIEMK